MEALQCRNNNNSNTNKIIVVFLSYWVLLLGVYCYRADGIIKMPRNATVTGMILFGDSIVDTGNNNEVATLAKCNFLPYGRDFLGGKPTGRFSNGKVPTDFMAEELGIKMPIPSYMSVSLPAADLLTGVNFASGGSGYDPLSPKLLSVIPLSEQLEQFKEYIGKLKANFGEERTNFILSKSVVLVVASSNDISNSYFATGIRKAQYDINSYTDMLVQIASSFIMEIYKLGARRIGVFNAPPIGCLPFQRTLFGGTERKCSQEVNDASKLFNAKLSSVMNSLRHSLTQAKLVDMDVYNPLLHIIENPSEYGFEVVDRGCCGTGTVEAAILCNPLDLQICNDDSKYVFWDSFHPTQRTYQILVSQVLNKYVNNF
ncbi:GDSL esterase/lipase EXL3-like [Arachis stenosperma]|uniref:GDSL esterase/lipase EXL3-like n=1 Tax=Arachis stenosperma TaxID=217475 RepID=UPI0025ACC89E|nr:GDSL esterase/lipase EXL3-like [Arachis stenosperma]